MSSITEGRKLLATTEYSAGDEIKIPGMPSHMKDQVLRVSRLDYTNREIYIGSKAALSFNQCQLKLVQKLGEVESFCPIQVFCRFNLEAKMFSAMLSFRALGFAALSLEELVPFYPLRTWITIYEKNEKTLKAIFTARMLSVWKDSDHGDPFFSQYAKLREYPM